MIPVEEELRLPPRPAAPAPVGFPIMATVAPLLAAGVIWALTGSAFALVFAVLSPVIAVASMLDTRRLNRKRRRTDAATRAQTLYELRNAVDERHHHLRHAQRRNTPAPATILAGDPGPWLGSTLVTLGSGPTRSGLRLGGEPGDEPELRAWAAVVTDAPIPADGLAGIGFVGSAPLARAAARAVLVQLCFALHPNQVTLDGDLEDWTAALPHLGARAPVQRIFVTQRHPLDAPRPAPQQPAAGLSETPTAAGIAVALAPTIDALPPGCGTVVALLGPGRARILRSSEHAEGLDFSPHLVSIEEAALIASRLHVQARSEGLAAARTPLPNTVGFADVNPGTQHQKSPGLTATIGVGEYGPLTLDLESAGPHAVVGGTTGSGKSELLVTWVTALAARYPPSSVCFLLVDFKGGAAFDPLRELPHCVGLITDLDPAAAERALLSLAAELRYRERFLAQLHLRDLGDASAASLPRLVIVVDEFATMLGAFGTLHDLFVDIAARGRSLGVHLILCTQRPAGVVRDSLMANCSLRISLRVNNRLDSTAVIGTDAAAALSPHLPGLALVAPGGGPPMLCQVATTSLADVRSVADSSPRVARPRRPWLDPLPHRLERSELDRLGADPADPLHAADGAPSGYPIGLLDEPELQRYRIARYDPNRDGHLLVLGADRSGKSAFLTTLAAHTGSNTALDLVDADVEGTWDALAGAYRELESGQARSSRLLLLDDFDAVCARWGPEHRSGALDLVHGLLRDGPHYGLHLVIALQQLGSGLTGLHALCPSVLLLRQKNTQEQVAAGGVAAHFDPDAPPGRGRWQGVRIQVLGPTDAEEPAAPGTPAAEPRPPHDLVPPLDFERPLLVVSATPGRTANRLRAVLRGRGTVVDLADLAGLTDRAGRGVPGGPPAVSTQLELSDATGGTALVGDAEAWQTQWALQAALRPRANLVFDGSTLAEFRVIARRRDLPPPIAPGRGRVWVLTPHGDLLRATLPASPPAPPSPPRESGPRGSSRGGRT